MYVSIRQHLRQRNAHTPVISLCCAVRVKCMENQPDIRYLVPEVRYISTKLYFSMPASHKPRTRGISAYVSIYVSMPASHKLRTRGRSPSLTALNNCSPNRRCSLVAPLSPSPRPLSLALLSVAMRKGNPPWSNQPPPPLQPPPPPHPLPTPPRHTLRARKPPAPLSLPLVPCWPV
jgi:hypothetical protein